MHNPKPKPRSVGPQLCTCCSGIDRKYKQPGLPTRHSGLGGGADVKRCTSTDRAAQQALCLSTPVGSEHLLRPGSHRHGNYLCNQGRQPCSPALLSQRSACSTHLLHKAHKRGGRDMHHQLLLVGLCSESCLSRSPGRLKSTSQSKVLQPREWTHHAPPSDLIRALSSTPRSSPGRAGEQFPE